MSKIFTVLKQSGDETRVVVAYAERAHAIRCAQALAGHHAALLRRCDEEMLNSPVASDLYQVVSKEDAIGVHFSTIHAIAREPGSSTCWLVQEIDLIEMETSPVGEGAGTKQLLTEGNQR